MRRLHIARYIYSFPTCHKLNFLEHLMCMIDTSCGVEAHIILIRATNYSRDVGENSMIPS